MAKYNITLPDNSVKSFDHAPTVLDVASSIGPRLAKDTLGGLVNGKSDVVDLRFHLSDGDKLKIITTKDPQAVDVIRHSAAHVMAQAVQEIWPDIQVTIGPVIDNGFYYDFYSERPFHPDDLVKIEKKMQELIKKDLPVTKEVISSKEAVDRFTKMNEKFKAEIITDLNTDEVSIYHQGDWQDLCRGPHVQSLGQIKAVKVLSLAGAYWRGDENKEQLQRIYATAFNSKEDLEKHLHNLEEAKKRDHRRLGKDLNLFVFHQFAPGSPFFTPNGTVIYNELQSFIRDKYKQYGYQEVITPQIYDLDLFHQSGHYENYRENMYFTKVDDRDFSSKPMNCPGHCLLYASDRKSYRELPWRVADFGRLHRNEKSGVMHGLTRVRSFSQDDAHIFCRMDQVQSEIEAFMTFLNEVYTSLGMNEYKVFLSTRPEKRMGEDSVWDAAEGALESALKNLNLDYTINEGDGAFYGPKLDIMFVDSLNRPWQLGTLQADFNLPKAFHLSYIGEDNSEHQPVMLHRAILGSFERFIGVYLEHTAGHMPTWLSPTQVRILNVTSDQQDYCEHIYKHLKEKGIRVHLDDRSEKLGYKIREGQMQKTPYMLIIGKQEKDAETVSVRLRTGDLVNQLTLEAFTTSLQIEIQTRSQHTLFKADPKN